MIVLYRLFKTSFFGCLFYLYVTMKRNEERRPSESFVMGVVALVFLVIGYQTALFIHRAAVLKIEADRDRPDTVYVYETVVAETDRKTEGVAKPHIDSKTVRNNSEHSPKVAAVRENLSRRKVESFSFDPNTVTQDDLCRLGFTPKQAQSLINYRQKGGRYRRKSDFAKSFVVSDSIYRRLEPYIDIPLIDLNLADSAAFDALPGIGGWFAGRIIEHRNALKGYSHKEQLMDIWKFDRQKYDALEDLITVSPENVTPYPLWTYPADSLRKHPYIRNYETARAIVLFRENTPRSEWTLEALQQAGVITAETAQKLSRCSVSLP